MFGQLELPSRQITRGNAGGPEYCGAVVLPKLIVAPKRRSPFAMKKDTPLGGASVVPPLAYPAQEDPISSDLCGSERPPSY